MPAIIVVAALCAIVAGVLTAIDGSPILVIIYGVILLLLLVAFVFVRKA